ncbi:MAG: T9SS type A sorting domain-containing protein [bacterium]|nr:T9SS type A sorting domain-containing protein [bacterium]
MPGLVWIVGTDGRTLASRDGGLSWTYNQTDSSETEFDNASLISSTLGYAYDRTNGVIWRWNGEFVSANSTSFVPTDFSISAYPNPFNSTLSISLTLPAHEQVEITLYNLLGREVEVIHRGRLDNATLSYTVPPSLASGIYFLRAATATQTQMQKVVLLK